MTLMRVAAEMTVTIKAVAEMELMLEVMLESRINSLSKYSTLKITMHLTTTGWASGATMFIVTSVWIGHNYRMALQNGTTWGRLREISDSASKEEVLMAFKQLLVLQKEYVA